jgi:hypothetical protein
MMAVPAEVPNTRPDEAPIVATAALLVVQLPPVVLLVSVVEVPAQIADTPDIAAGCGLTVTTAVERQLVLNA